MTSRVIHIRLDDIALAQCYKTMEANGQNIIQVPMATAVAQCLKAFIRGAEVSGHLSVMTSTEAFEMLASLNAGPDCEIDDFAGVEPVFDVDDSAVMPDLSESIQSALNAVLSGGAVASAPADLPDVEPDDSPIFKYAEISLVAPLDTLVQQAASLDKDSTVSDEDVTRFEDAICIVYSNLDQDMWGTEKAMELVTSVHQQLGAQT